MTRQADHREALSTSLVLSIVFASIVGCGGMPLDGTDALEAAVSFEAAGSDLTDRFRPDPEGLGYVLDDVAADDTLFDRVAFMIDAGSEPTIDVRIFGGNGGGWTAWMPAQITWSEGVLHNAHVDLPHGGTHVQLRLRDPEPREVSFLLLEGFVVVPEESAHDQDLGGLGTRAQALAADDAVDVNRSGWNARASRCSSRTTFDRITVHHTATPNNDSSTMPARMRQMQSYHMDNRSYCDIGYHFLIGQDGKVYQGRAETLLGGHVLNNNSRNAGVSFIGTFTSQAPSNAMMSAGAKALSAIACEYDIELSSAKVRGHRDYARGNECPGTALYNRLSGLIGDAAGLVCSDGSTPPASSDSPGPAAPPSTGTTGSTAPAADAPHGKLVGVIYEAPNSSRRIAGATVSLSNGVSAVTGSNGYFTLSVPAGTYTMTVSASGYQTASASRRVSANTQTWGCLGLRRLEARGTLVGVVYAEPYTNQRIFGATVTLSTGQTATSGSDGSFRFEVAPGTYRVTAGQSGYATVTIVRSVERGAQSQAAIGLFEISHAVGELAGVIFVKPDTAERVPGARVWTSTGQSAVADEQGIYLLHDVPVGQVSVYAGKEGYLGGSVDRQVEAGRRVYASIALTLGTDDEEEPSEDEIRVISPTGGQSAGSNPEFVWENVSEEQAGGADFGYRVVVVSKDGVYSFEGSIAGAVDGESRTTIGLSLAAGTWLWAVYAITDEGDLRAASAMHEFVVG